LEHAPEARREPLAYDDRRPGRWAHQHPVEDSEVPVPYGGYAEKYCHEEHALREYPGREVIEVAHPLGREPPHFQHDDSEEEQPQKRLHRPREELYRVVPYLLELGAHIPVHLHRVVRYRPRQPSRGMRQSGGYDVLHYNSLPLDPLRTSSCILQKRPRESPPR